MLLVILAALAASPTSVELFTDKGEMFIRAGTQAGLRVGQEVRVLGERIADTQERRTAGHLTVLEVWDSLARVSLDAAAQAVTAPGSIELEIVRRVQQSDDAFAAPVYSRPRPRPQHNPFIPHEYVAGFTWLGVWAVTLLVDLTLGDSLAGTSIIPIFGPFITEVIVHSAGYRYAVPAYEVLLVLSGVVQTGLFTYFIVSLVKAATWVPTVAFLPVPGGAAASVRFSW